MRIIAPLIGIIVVVITYTSQNQDPITITNPAIAAEATPAQDDWIAPDPCTLDVVVCDDEEEESAYDVIRRIAKEEGFDRWEIVTGICEIESECGRGNMVGDNGKSHGYYHIYTPNVCEFNGNAKHCIASADRYDLEKSTRWTIKRLQRHEALGEREMIRSHNGLVSDHRNESYVDAVYQRINERVISK